MIAPPLTAERLLQSLSAKTDFRDGILGDLAEEYAERAESEGVSAARRWYYREAARAAPHLLLHWARRLRAREIRRLVNVIVAAYFLVSTFVTFSMLMAQKSLEMLGISASFLALSSSRAAWMSQIACAAVFAMMAGYCAASLDKKTPLASAMLLGVLWSVVAVASLIMSDSAYSPWYFLAATITMIIGTTRGGMLQVRNARFDNRQEYQEWRDKHVAS